MTGKTIRVAVIGVGDFGRNHVRVWRSLDDVQLVGIVDSDSNRAQQVASDFGTRVFTNSHELAGHVDAVSLAVPTVEHARIGRQLLELGIDVLVEKPMAAFIDQADALISTAERHGRILQVGHLERFNPAVLAAQQILTQPLFFEVHRLGVFTPRSLDIDVVYDVMIHDLDILLAFVDAPVVDVKAVGIPVLTEKVDIAHARLEFETGAVANVTASRVSTERVRKMRFFQRGEYISLDFTRQDVLRVRVKSGGAQPDMQFEKIPAVPEEPLRAELLSFADSVRTRRKPSVDGAAGRRALELADRVMAGILDHARGVQLSALASQEIP